MLSDIHKRFWREKDMPDLCCKQLHGWNIIKELSANGWNLYFGIYSLSYLALAFFFYSLEWILTSEKNILQCRVPTMFKGYIIQSKTWHLSIFWKPQKPYAPVRIEVNNVRRRGRLRSNMAASRNAAAAGYRPNWHPDYRPLQTAAPS